MANPVYPIKDFTFNVFLEVTSGFSLDNDQLNTGVLGYLLTDIEVPVRNVSWKRGKAKLLDSFSAGSAQIVFDNNLRELDPQGPSPFASSMRPGRRVKIEASFTIPEFPNSYNQRTCFTGYVDKVSYDYGRGEDATVNVSVIDAFGRFAQTIIPSLSVPSELSGARMNRILNQIGWPLSDRQIDPGTSVLAAEVLENQNVLQYLNSIVVTEFGQMWINEIGEVVFKQRNLVNYSASVYSEMMETIEMDYSFDEVINSIILTNGVSSVSAQNTTSIAEYGYSEKSFEVLVSDISSLQILADGLVNLYGTPKFMLNQTTASALWHSFIRGGIDINSLGAFFNFYPPGGSPPLGYVMSPPVIVTGVSHSASPKQWNQTLNYDLAIGYGAFLLDNPSFGILDESVLGL